MIGFEDLVYLFSTPADTRGICRLNFDEAALLYKYTKEAGSHGFGDVIEIGRWDGGSTVIMASATPGFVYSIDIQKRPDVDKNIKSVKDKIELIHGDSSTVGRRWLTPVSLIFVDGDHNLRGAKKDVLAWKDHIRSGGYMLLHDVLVSDDLLLDPHIRQFNLKELLPLLEEDFECVDNTSSLVVLRKRK